MHLSTLCAVMSLAYDVNSSLCITRDSDDSDKKCFSGKKMETLPKSVRKLHWLVFGILLLNRSHTSKYSKFF